MIEKTKLLNLINDLPDSIDMSELLDRILLLNKIEIAVEQGDKGLTMSTNEAKSKLNKWLK